MKKLKLELDDLKVESFETSSQNSRILGTIKGNVSNSHINCTNCEPTNAGTCLGSCPDGVTCGKVPTCDHWVTCTVFCA